MTISEKAVVSVGLHVDPEELDDNPEGTVVFFVQQGSDARPDFVDEDGANFCAYLRDDPATIFYFDILAKLRTSAPTSAYPTASPTGPRGDRPHHAAPQLFGACT